MNYENFLNECIAIDTSRPAYEAGDKVTSWFEVTNSKHNIQGISAYEYYLVEDENTSTWTNYGDIEEQYSIINYKWKSWYVDWKSYWILFMIKSMFKLITEWTPWTQWIEAE